MAGVLELWIKVQCWRFGARLKIALEKLLSGTEDDEDMRRWTIALRINYAATANPIDGLDDRSGEMSALHLLMNIRV